MERLGVDAGPRPDFGPLFRIRKFPMPRRRKRGRPRTGSKPVVPVRLAAKQVNKIAKLAELQGVDRSTVMRQLIDIGLASGQVTLLMRRPGTQGRGAVGASFARWRPTSGSRSRNRPSCARRRSRPR